MKLTVDQYLIDGCMRCKYGATPQCKVNDWKKELILLRQIALESGLLEEIKWGVPCYTLNGKNVFNISALKNHCAIGFFKGSLLEDPNGNLISPGENSQAVRYLKFTSTRQVIDNTNAIKAFMEKAIAIEQAGKKVPFKKNPEPLPEELLQKFEELPALKEAFFALTPGRQRGYILHFSQPKQVQTRFNRIEKCLDKIMRGEGFSERWAGSSEQ